MAAVLSPPAMRFVGDDLESWKRVFLERRWIVLEVVV